MSSENSSAPHFKTSIVNCPACGQTTQYAPENRFRPFCSPRCKGIDFGAWANENFRVPIKPSVEDIDYDD